MINSFEKKFPSRDGIHQLAGMVFLPEGEPKGIFHMVHGMVEHKERYYELLERIAACGFVCLVFDNLGHGASVNDEAELGFIAEKDGWRLLCDDVYAFGMEMKREYGEKLPYILAGHSMGSFIVRLTAAFYPDLCDRLLVIGTGRKNPAAPLGLVMMGVLKKTKGSHSYSDFAEKLSVGNYNDRFTDENDDLSWLNTIESERDIYRADRLCNFRFTVGAMHDLVRLNIESNSKKCFEGIRADMPILMLSGSDDPVGEHSLGAWEVYEGFRKTGHDKVRLKLYKGCRHEIMHDTCKEEFTLDIISFIGAC